MRGRSTITNLACFSQFLSKCLDNNSQVDVIYTDFCKAFDCIDHYVLIQKLSNFGFSNSLVELVPTLMIDDAETKMRTEASVLFELKTSVPFCHALQIFELIYVHIYLARNRQVLR
jgi:hypothetical protein